MKKNMFFEFPSDIIFQQAKEKGFVPVDYSGRKLNNPLFEGIGFAKQKRNRLYFTGFVWLDTDFADPDERWVLEIYGKEYFKDIYNIVTSSRDIYQTEIYADFWGSEEVEENESEWIIDIDIFLHSEKPIPISRLKEIRTWYLLNTLYGSRYYER